MNSTAPFEIDSLVAGRPVRSPRRLPIRNPATGERIGSVGIASPDVIDEAITAASAAFASWSERPVAERARLLARFRGLIERDRHHLAGLITREHGKPTADALGSIQRGIEVVEYASAAVQLLKGEHSDQVALGVQTRTLKKPLGVCVGVTPYNYPAMIPLWMFPLALMCGNAFVLKPSERTPSASNRLAELLAEAGAPAGLLNVLHGDAGVVGGLIAHEGVQAVSFVGSTGVAASVYRAAAQHGKRVQALGGAKNHAIVMPDADVAVVVDGLLNGAFNSAGQRCMAISVAVMVGEAYERFVGDIVRAAGRLMVGDGNDAKTDVPPLISPEHRQRIHEILDEAVARGARLRLDGRHPNVPEHCGGGFFLGPTIVDEVGREMAVYREEVFGPVLVLMRASCLEDAIALSNEHRLGNGAVLFTSSGASAARFERDIQCGMPGVNVPVPSPVAYHSFGGWKASMFGDLALHGPDAVAFYTRRQVLTSRW